jgi:hypothetical protein
MGAKLNLRQLFIRDFPPGGIEPAVECCLYAHALLRGSRPHQGNAPFMTEQRATPPVETAMREQAVLDLVPLARPRRQLTDRDWDPPGIRQLLELHFPEAHATPLAAAASGTDSQRLGLLIEAAPPLRPPPPTTLYRNTGRVLVAAHVHPPQIATHLIDAVRDRCAELGSGKVRDVDLLGLPLRLPLLPPLALPPPPLLLLRIHREPRPALGQRGLPLRVAVFKLRIAVCLTASFQGLGVRLQTLAQLPQQLADHPITYARAPCRQRTGQLARALTGPAQRPLRVPTGHRGPPLLQLLPNRRQLRAHPLTPPTGVPDALSCQHGPGQVLEPPVHRGTIHPRRAGDLGTPSIPPQRRSGGSHQAALALIERRQAAGILLK